jgi:hypothetical protein
MKISQKLTKAYIIFEWYIKTLILRLSEKNIHTIYFSTLFL